MQKFRKTLLNLLGIRELMNHKNEIGLFLPQQGFFCACCMPCGIQ
jgi:hypothetical protein